MAAECFPEDTRPLLLPALGASAGQYRVGTGCPCILALSSENIEFELWLYMLSPCMSCHTVQHCTPGKIQEHLPNDLHLGIFILLAFSARESPMRRHGLPWPFAQQCILTAAEVPGTSGSGCRRAHLGQPLAALCSISPSPSR